MKGFVLILACFVVTLVGCSSASSVMPGVTVPPTDQNSDINGQAVGEPPETRTWISPGKVQIGNFYPGATAEWPVTIHYGPTETDYFTSITAEGQTDDFAVLSRPLYQDSPDSVQALECLDDTDSPKLNDSPVAVSYDAETQTLIIDGLAPDDNRTLVIRYSYDLPATFAVYYEPSHNRTDGYEMAPDEAQDWIVIAEPTPVLMPFETREIMVSISLPPDATVPDQWEFLIAMVNKSEGGNIAIEMCSRWMISMRR